MLQTLVLPIPFNLDTLYLPMDLVLLLVKVQEFLSSTMGFDKVIVNKGFVLTHQAHPRNSERRLWDTSSSGSSSVLAARRAAVAAAIPLRLRQVAAVEFKTGAKPAEAVLVLVGGDTVRVGDIYEGPLSEVQDHEVRPWYCLVAVGTLSARMMVPVKPPAG